MSLQVRSKFWGGGDSTSSSSSDEADEAADARDTSSSSSGSLFASSPKAEVVRYELPYKISELPIDVYRFFRLIANKDITTCVTTATRELVASALPQIDDEGVALSLMDLVNARIGDGLTPEDPDFHRRGVEVLETIPWLRFTLHKLERMCKVPVYLNMNHIVEGEAGHGFHFAEPKNVHLIEKVRRCGPTGVFCGWSNGKFSSFFPPGIATEENLVRIIKSAELIAQTGNRVFMRARTTPQFFFEAYMRRGGLIMHSAFPAMAFITKLQDVIVYPGFVLSARKLARYIAKTKPLYQLGARAIYDIAPHISQWTNIASGLLVLH